MGTVNIALNKKATATNYIAPYSPARAVDGNTTLAGSRWLCRTPGAMIIDIGAPIKVDKWSIQDMSILWGSATTSDPKYKNNKVDLYLSLDGNSWTLVDSMLNGGATKDIPIVNARYAKIGIDTGKGFAFNNKMASIVDFKLFAADPTPNTLTGFVVTGNNGVVRPYTPIFASATQQYTSLVGADVASVTIKPTATDTKAIVKVNGIVVATEASSAAITLLPGINTVTITVEPSVGPVYTYTLTITKESNNLSGLVVKNGNDIVPITPAFDKNTITYSAAVANTVTSVSVVPTVENSNSTVTVNSNPLVGGLATVNLVPGLNTINVAVKAKSGAVKTYTVNVTQCSPYLSGLSIKDGANVVAYTPSFDMRVFPYTAYVSNTVKVVTVTPVPQDSSATVTVNGNPLVSGSANVNLNLGSNTITVIVTPKVGDSLIYTVTTISSTSPFLKQVLFQFGLSGTNTIQIANTNDQYSLIVPANTVFVNVTPTAIDSNAKIAVNGILWVPGQKVKVNLTSAITIFTVIVTSSDGLASKTYTFRVNK